MWYCHKLIATLVHYFTHLQIPLHAGKRTMCQKQRLRGLLTNTFVPECDQKGQFVSKQCEAGNNLCDPAPANAINCGKSVTFSHFFKVSVAHWYIALDCWPTFRAIHPMQGTLFITKFISLAQVVPDTV